MFHLFSLFPDAELVLCLLLVKIDWVRRYHFLRAAKEKVANHAFALVPPLFDTDRSVALGQIHFRFVEGRSRFMECILMIFVFWWLSPCRWTISLVGGNATFPNILNNFVHVLMYFYYMLSAMGPQYQKYLWWKRYMTEIQIVSFAVKLIIIGDSSSRLHAETSNCWISRCS